MSPRYANGHISAMDDPIHFMFGSMVGFSGLADRMPLFLVTSNPWRPAAILENFEFSMMAEHPLRICATGDPIHFMFGSTVGFSGSADRMALFPVTSNASWRQAAILDNFEWPHLRNGSFDPFI